MPFGIIMRNYNINANLVCAIEHQAISAVQMNGSTENDSEQVGVAMTSSLTHLLQHFPREDYVRCFGRT